MNNLELEKLIIDLKETKYNIACEKSRNFLPFTNREYKLLWWLDIIKSKI